MKSKKKSVAQIKIVCVIIWWNNELKIPYCVTEAQNIAEVQNVEEDIMIRVKITIIIDMNVQGLDRRIDEVEGVGNLRGLTHKMETILGVPPLIFT